MKIVNFKDFSMPKRFYRTFQGRFNFQGLFKKALYIQIVCANPGMAVHIPLRMRCFWTMPRMPLESSDNWPMQQQLSMLHSPTNSHMFNLPHLIWPSPYSKWMVAYLLGLADFFPNHLVFKNSLRDTFRVSNSLNPDQARHNVVPDLGPNCS